MIATLNYSGEGSERRDCLAATKYTRQHATRSYIMALVSYPLRYAHPPHIGGAYALWKYVCTISPWIGAWLQSFPQQRHIRLHGIANTASNGVMQQIDENPYAFGACIASAHCVETILAPTVLLCCDVLMRTSMRAIQWLPPQQSIAGP